MTASRHAVRGRRIVPGRRFVFDAAALVGATLRPSSPAAQAFSLARSTGIVCSSEPALDQLAAILNRRSLDRYISSRARIAFVDLLRRHAWLCASSANPPRKSRAQQFKTLLAFAASAEADALVTTTPIPRTRSSWGTLAILTAEEFLSRYAGAQ
jgi:predicted nucleic acid-binding protein